MVVFHAIILPRVVVVVFTVTIDPTGWTPELCAQRCRSQWGSFIPLSCGHNGSWSSEATEVLTMHFVAIGLI